MDDSPIGNAKLAGFSGGGRTMTGRPRDGPGSGARSLKDQKRVLGRPRAAALGPTAIFRLRRRICEPRAAALGLGRTKIASSGVVLTRAAIPGLGTAIFSAPTEIFRAPTRSTSSDGLGGWLLRLACAPHGFFVRIPMGKSLHGLSLPLGRSLGLLKSLGGGGGSKIPTAPCCILTRIE